MWTRNSAIDGRGRGTNHRGSYRFNGTRTGNAFGDFLLGYTRDVSDRVSTRGDTDGHSDDFAVFLQDDWRVNNDVTVFLGLRYELAGAWHEKGDILGNFSPEDGGHHVVPNAQVATLLPPGLQALGRTQIASDVGMPDTLINSDTNNFSPRVGFAWRVGGNDQTVLRGGFGLFHPTVAIQGLRDSLASNMFRYAATRSGAAARPAGSAGALSAWIPTDFGSQGIDPNLQSPDIYQYNLSLERQLGDALGLRVSYIGSTMRKLLIYPDLNHLPASTTPFDPSNPDDCARLNYPLYGYYMGYTKNGGEGQLHAAQVELKRRWKDGLALNVAYTYAHSDSQRAGLRQQQPGRHRVRHLRPRGGPRSGPERREAPPRPERHLGHPGRKGTQARLEHAGVGGRPLRRLDRVHALPGAQRQQPDPVLLGLLHDEPLEHGPVPRHGQHASAARGDPDQIKDPNTGGSRDAFYDVTAFAMPADGQLGNMKKNSLLGPGTWVVNFGIYKDIVTKDRFRLQFSALLDNAFNHPQFYAFYGDRLLRYHRLHPRRHQRQRDDGQPGLGGHRQPGRLRTRESLPDRLESHLLESSSVAAWSLPLPAERGPRRLRLSPCCRTRS